MNITEITFFKIFFNYIYLYIVAYIFRYFKPIFQLILGSIYLLLIVSNSAAFVETVSFLLNMVPLSNIESSRPSGKSTRNGIK